jgi:hypothetical protein
MVNTRIELEAVKLSSPAPSPRVADTSCSGQNSEVSSCMELTISKSLLDDELASGVVLIISVGDEVVL